MQTKLLARATAAAVFGVVFGLCVYHSYLKWNSLGQAAFLSYENHRFMHLMAHPGRELPLLLSCVILALIGAGLYELIVAGIAKLTNLAR